MSTVVGYIPQDAGFVLCPRCAVLYAQRNRMDLNSSEDFGVMFESSEGDSYGYCDNCMTTIEHALTDDGKWYEASYILMREFKDMGLDLTLSSHSKRSVLRMPLTLDQLRAICLKYADTLDDLKCASHHRTLDNLIDRLWHDVADKL